MKRETGSGKLCLGQLGLLWGLMTLFIFPALAVGRQDSPPSGAPNPPTGAMEPTTNRLDQDPETAARASFLAQLAGLRDYLAGRSAFELKMESRSSMRGVDSPATAVNALRLRSAQNGDLRLEISSGDQPEPKLIVFNDGQQTTHYYRPADLYQQRTVEAAKAGVRECELTNASLSICGGDFLFREDLAAHVAQQLVHVRDLGIETNLHQFRLELNDGRQVDIWFDAAQDRPLPVKLVSEIGVALEDGTRQSSVRTTRFEWKMDVDLDKGIFQFTPDAEARQVESLAEALTVGEPGQLIGQPVPKLALNSIDGQPASWSEGQPRVLYFWASWAAPSARRIPDLEQYREKLQGQGVEIHAVDVAESAEQVAAFVKELGYQGSVLLDPEGQAAEQLRLSELPAVVLIDSQGIVRAIFQRVDEATRPEIDRALPSLLPPKK